MNEARAQAEKLKHYFIFIFVFTILNTLSVFAVPGKTTYQAKIIKPDGYPLEATSVNFKFTILDPVGSCILYSETYSSVNMSSTGGLISFALGSGVKTYPASATTFEQVFSNITPSLSCDTGGPASYTPTGTDIRKIVMQFHDGSGWQTLPAMSINAVPYAMYANEATKLNGLQASDFVQVSTVPTCAASEALRYTGTGFTCVAVGNSVTSSTVVTALGYTPADGVSVTTLTSNVSSVSSTVFSVSSTVTSLQNSVAASFAAITSSQWTTSGTNIFYNTGNIGIGTITPVTSLDVSGGVRIGAESTTCAPALAGTLRYNASNVEYCNGTSWQAFGVSGAGITNFNGSTSGTQSFATGAGGTAPNIVTANGVHTLNIPLASTGSVTAGLISNTDYTTFSNKITSSAASIAQVLGYVPADNAASGTYAQKANNLSDLTNIATARTNLGLGTFATASSIDLGSASATGILAIARLPSFTGDATIAAASNTIILSDSGVTAGTYTKVTVDAKGRVTSSSALASSDVTAALGYTPASATASTQWTTSGSAIYYNTGNVGIGTSNPVSILHLRGAPAATANYGLVSIGNGPFDGSSSGFFTGNANGVVHAINTAAGFTGEFTHYQNGTSDARFIVKSDGSVVSGRGTVNGSLSSSFGGLNTVNGVHAFAVGHFNQSSGNYTFSSGLFSTASGDNSTAMGYAITANSLGMTAIGINNVVPTGTSTNTWQGTDPIFVIGNGQGSAPASASTAMTVLKNGNVGIGTTAPTAKLHLASGTTSAAPLKFTSGTLLTAPQSGTMEYDGANFYLTDSTSTRRAIATGSSAGTIDNTSNINSSGNITMTPTGSVVVSSTTASTNSSTGALVVNGGLGVAGNLNVAGTISGSAKVIATGFRANQGAPDSNDSSTNGYAFGADGDTGMFSPGSGAANGVLAFYGNNTELMRITSSGAVGIGTTAPAKKLDVNGDINLGNTIGNSALTIISNATTGLSRLVMDPGTGNNRGFLDYDNSSRSMILRTNEVERMRIDTSGNVGVGTSAPSERLHVNGKVLAIGRFDSNGAPTDTGVFNRVQGTAHSFFGPYATYVNAGTNSDLTIATYQADPIVFRTAGAEQMRLTAAGNVGIGTSSPLGGLHVKTSPSWSANNYGPSVIVDGSRNNALALLDSTSGNPWAIANAGGVLSFSSMPGLSDTTTAASIKMTINSSGNVGIGTTTPGSYKLKVVGDLNSFVEAAGVYGTTFRQNSGGTNQIYSDYYSGATALPLSLGVFPSTQALNITASGNVGIGTTSPSTALHLSRGDASIMTFGANTTYGGILAVGSTNAAPTNATTAAVISTNGNLHLDAATAKNVYIGNYTATNTFINPVGGNVGIGTTTPDRKFYVADTSNTQSTILAYNQGATFTGTAIEAITDRTASSAFNLMNLKSSTTSMFLVRGDGNVGIGTTTPLETLHIAGASSGSADQTLVQIGDPSSGSGPLYLTYNAPFISGNTYFNTGWKYGGGQGKPSSIGLSNGLAFYTADEVVGAAGAAANMTAKMTITSNGNVGIGTTSPSYSLDVSGDMRITGTPYRNGGDSAWIVPSDARLKDVVGDYKRGLREIANIETIIFKYKKDNPKQIDSSVAYTGVIAQEVQKQIPEAVKVEKDGFLSLNTTPIFWAMINAIKEIYHDVVGIKSENAQLKIQAETQTRKIQSLEEENAAMKARLERIEKALEKNQ